MIMSNKYFLLDRREQCDVLTCRSPRKSMVLLPGQLEELARFLGPLHDEIVLEAHRKLLDKGREPC